MKKFGFTLAEILVALGIIGIIAAITVGAIKNILPDKDKVAVLKTYKMIIDANQAILDNKRIITYDSDGCDGLACLKAVRKASDDIGIDQIEGVDPSLLKGFPYGILFANQLHLDAGPMLIGSSDNIIARFDTVDGVKWAVGKSGNEYTITVDFGEANKCQGVYNKDNCQKPAWFSFFVNNKGYVYGNDPLTTAFLENNETINRTDVDYKTAEEDNATYRSIKMPALPE